MPLAKSLNSYYDVEQVLTTARKRGGLVYRFATSGAAVHWRSRAYYYRKLLATADAKQNPQILGYVPSTEWDDMVLTVDGASVRVAFGELKGQLETLDGQPIEPPKVPPKRKKAVAASDDLTGLALQLADEIGKEKL